MNAIEVLSANFNFSVDDAVSILTTNNKKSRSKAKAVQPKKEVEDLFAQLVNDSDDEASRGKTYEFDLKPVPETVIITTTTFEASDVKKPAKKEKKTVDPEKEKANKELYVKKVLKELEKEKAKEAKILKELEKQKANEEEKEAKKKLSEDKEEMKKQKLLNKDVAALEKKAVAEAAIEAKKVAKEQEKLAAIEAKKQAKEQEKLAAIEAKKQAKEQEKSALKAAKEQEKKEKKPVNKKSTKPESDETTTKVDEAPVKVSVKRIKIGEHEYLKSESNILYNPETKEEVGLYDAESNSIKPLPDDDEEELEEDNYDM
jgi:hypothetical protein